LNIDLYFNLRNFIEAIGSFSQVQRLEDTMSTIDLTMTEESQSSVPFRDEPGAAENPCIVISHKKRWKIAGDPGRVIYPAVGKLKACEWLKQVICEMLNSSLLPYLPVNQRPKICLGKGQLSSYEFRETKAISDEIDALTEFRGGLNIAQLVGVVISENLRWTCLSIEMPPEITELLLEY
jgi:hypothetical protein